MRHDYLYDDWADSESLFYDDPAFIRYCGEIQAALIECGPMTIGDIHRRLGRERMRWTMAALEWIGVEVIGVPPTRFAISNINNGASTPAYSNDYVFSHRAPYRRRRRKRGRSDAI